MFNTEPIEGCNCLGCVLARGSTVKGSKSMWDKDRFSNPYTAYVDWRTWLPDLAGMYAAGWGLEEETPSCTDYPVETKSVPEHVGPYRFNYSIVDNYGFGSTHSVVLDMERGSNPFTTFSEFMELSEGYVRYHLIEYFPVRWENSEYVRT